MITPYIITWIYWTEKTENAQKLTRFRIFYYGVPLELLPNYFEVVYDRKTFKTKVSKVFSIESIIYKVYKNCWIVEFLIFLKFLKASKLLKNTLYSSYQENYLQFFEIFARKWAEK